jgi:hypothetical protein
VIDLDDTIDAHLSEFPGADRITLRHLLGHRAGVFDPSAQLVSDRDGPDPDRVFTATAIVDAAAAGTPTFPPGSQHDYCRSDDLHAVFGSALLGEDSLDAMLDGSSGGGSYGLGIYRSGSVWVTTAA